MKNKSTYNKVNQSKVLEHQLEEWRSLNAYVNQIDTGYQQSFVMVISIFSVLAVLFSSNSELASSKGILIIPPGIVAVLAFVSYQFRITAILHGHLAALELKMNKALKENVHMWHSALTETFMARNNLINNYMMLPMFLLIIIMTIYCYLISLQAFEDIPHKEVFLTIYWVSIFVCGLIVLVPFFTNEKVRHETFFEKRVWRKYHEYLQEEKQKNTHFKYVKARISKETKSEDKKQ